MTDKEKPNPLKAESWPAPAFVDKKDRGKKMPADPAITEVEFSARIAAFRAGSRAFHDLRPGEELTPAELEAEKARILDFVRNELRSIAASAGHRDMKQPDMLFSIESFPGYTSHTEMRPYPLKPDTGQPLLEKMKSFHDKPKQGS